MNRSVVAAALLAALIVPQPAAAQSAKAKQKGKSAAMAKGKSAEAKAKAKSGEGEMGKMDHMDGPWKEMNAFHAVLAPAYHPVAQANNLKPLKAKAADLAATARTWAASTPPTACNTESIRTTVGQISTDALALSNQTLNLASDADLKKSITALHDKFETVEKSCASPGKGEGMKHEGMDHGAMMGGKKDSATMKPMQHDMKGMKHDMKAEKKPLKRDSLPKSK